MPTASDGGSVLYADTSALVKLVVTEAESADLTAWLAERDDHMMVTSALTRTELGRACRRYGLDAFQQAQSCLGAMSLLAITDDVLDRAARLDPLLLRTLDAIHLASALAFPVDLEAVVTYDLRMIDAAQELGLTVAHPGLTLS